MHTTYPLRIQHLPNTPTISPFFPSQPFTSNSSQGQPKYFPFIQNSTQTIIQPKWIYEGNTLNYGNAMTELTDEMVASFMDHRNHARTSTILPNIGENQIVPRRTTQ